MGFVLLSLRWSHIFKEIRWKGASNSHAHIYTGPIYLCINIIDDVVNRLNMRLRSCIIRDVFVEEYSEWATLEKSLACTVLSPIIMSTEKEPVKRLPSIYEESSQYRHWRFSLEKLSAIRKESNQAAVQRVQANFKDEQVSFRSRKDNANLTPL